MLTAHVSFNFLLLHLFASCFTLAAELLRNTSPTSGGKEEEALNQDEISDRHRCPNYFLWWSLRWEQSSPVYGMLRVALCRGAWHKRNVSSTLIHWLSNLFIFQVGINGGQHGTIAGLEPALKWMTSATAGEFDLDVSCWAGHTYLYSRE